MALVSAIVVPVSQLIIRSYIKNHESITSAGLWEGINRISIMYLLVITTSLSVYYLPRLAELRNKNELRKEIFSVYKLIIPLADCCYHCHLFFKKINYSDIIYKGICRNAGIIWLSAHWRYI